MGGGQTETEQSFFLKTSVGQHLLPRRKEHDIRPWRGLNKGGGGGG